MHIYSRIIHGNVGINSHVLHDIIMFSIIKIQNSEFDDCIEIN